MTTPNRELSESIDRLIAAIRDGDNDTRGTARLLAVHVALTGRAQTIDIVHPAPPGGRAAYSVLVLFSALVWFHGDSAMALIWGPAEPLATWAKMIAAIPLSALWALPTVGWLMFISAWARSKPFLWAVAVPVVVGILVGTFDIFEAVQLPDSCTGRTSARAACSASTRAAGCSPTTCAPSSP